jgi:hypothetical protein
MNFAKSFTYIFEDPDWFSKLWKPVLIGLIPIVGQLVLQGYMLNVTRNVVRGDQRPLYEMDFGEDLRVGFRMFLVQLVYALPFALLYSILSAILTPMAVRGLESGSGIAVGGLVGQLLITLLSLLISVVFFFVFPVISANVAVKGTFRAGFEFKELFEMVKGNLAAWLMVLGGSLIAGIIAPAGVILFFVGVIATSAYAGLMVAHLRGQAYRESTHTVQTQQPYYPGY